ncbi:hypothetical protein PTKIN_Ptkin18bG0089400 [Pterospermum kingtungense]
MASKPHHDAEAGAIITTDTIEGPFIFTPRAFNIVWGNDSRYWRIPSRSSLNNNNVAEAAELNQVSWLEVTGSVPLMPLASYQISFKVSFKGDAFGWSGAPVFLMAKVGKKGRYKWKRLKELENLPKTPTEVPSYDNPFIIDEVLNQPDTRLYFGLYEVWSGKWKGGLRVHEAIVKKKN